MIGSSHDVVLLALLFFAAALLYSSVGHAGASGYLAAMALFGLAPEVMKPTALVLNILVATIATVQFGRANCFSWGLFWPFALTSIPCAFLGGYLTVSASLYKRLVGAVLLFAAYRLFLYRPTDGITGTKRPSIVLGLLLGGLIGFLAGLTGVGGGIFLSPLLLLMGWAEPRLVSGVSAAFILVNSMAGLTGHLAGVQHLPGAIPYWAAAVVVGGAGGSTVGSCKLGNMALRRLLAVVLVIAGLKMVVF